MKDIPQIPESSAAVHPDLRRSLVRMREELQSLLGLRGDGSGAALRAGSATGGSTTVIIDTGGPGGGGGGGGGTPDLTPPPTPTFGPGDAFPGITTVLLTWAGIGYTQGNGHKQTVIYGVQREPSNPSLPTFGDAQRIATAPNALTITSIPSEPNTRWHLWLKFETNDGVESTVPAGGTNGVTVTTGQDVSDLLAVLTNQITGSQLYYDLAKPILGAAREDDAAAIDALRAALATHREQQNRGETLLEQAKARGTQITADREVTVSGFNQVARQITTITASVETTAATFTAALQDEQLARVNGDSAEAAARLLLAAQVNDPVTGLPATRATLASDYSTTVSMNAAIASSASALTTAFNAADAATLASANAFTYSRATIDGAIASSASTLTASYTAADAVVSAAVSTEASVRASETGHLAAQQTVRLDLNGYVVGYGISGTSGGTAGPTSQFLVRVDQFAIVPPTNYTSETAPVVASLNERWYQPSTRIVRRWDGSNWVPFNTLPFVVQAAPTTVNGVTIPAGVYMDAAYIVNLTATYAQISNLVADQIVATDISAARITAGFLNAARIQAGTITADKLNVTLLSAISASLGSVQIAAGGNLRSGQTAFDTGTGFWLGSDAGVPKFSIGSATKGLTWDGTALEVRGDVVLRQNLAAAADSFTSYQNIGTPTSTVTASHKFSVIATQGKVVLTGVTGYIDIYLDGLDTNVVDVSFAIRAQKGADARLGPKQAFAMGPGSLQQYAVLTNLYVMRVPLSLTWSFCGNYYTSRSYPPGTSGLGLLPVLNPNILETGTWDIFLDVSVQTRLFNSNTLDAAMEAVRTNLHGWAFEINGAVPYAPGGPLITV